MRSVIVRAFRDDLALAQGTGFIVDYERMPYLVTNYHVAAGRHPETGQPTHDSGAVPNYLEILLPAPNANSISWAPWRELVLRDDPDEALWLEHPVRGRAVDVVAIPMPLLQARLNLMAYPLPKIAGDVANLPAAQDVSIVGFPFGLTAGPAFPIWIRGSVATDPEIDFDDLPCFLIDARTRPGASGSPVISYFPTGVVPRDQGMTFAEHPVWFLHGIYSGRINEQSDLGKVWKVGALIEILRAQQIGRAGL
jgi:hypothetical protein